MTTKSAFLFLTFALAATACGSTLRVSGMNPHPRILVGAQAPRYSLDVSRVQDTIFTERMTVRDVQRALYVGLENALGPKFAPARAPDTITLVLDYVTADSVADGRRGLGLSYGGRWVAQDGRIIVEFRGYAAANDPDLFGKKNIEAVLANLLEQCVGHLAEAQARIKATQPPPPPPDAAPKLPPSQPPDLRLPPNKPPGT
ncbi:MAG: hypothetical protein JST00_20280 [Deltaproteobacteria bacterium]|nr:hypothetical protein [Deltaproteobacteria bacterium]